MKALLFCQITYLHAKFTSMITLKYKDKYSIKSMTPQLEITLEFQILGIWSSTNMKAPNYTNSLKTTLRIAPNVKNQRLLPI
jgi:hypothetical protein